MREPCWDPPSAKLRPKDKRLSTLPGMVFSERLYSLAFEKVSEDQLPSSRRLSFFFRARSFDFSSPRAKFSINFKIFKAEEGEEHSEKISATFWSQIY